ncbi:MAG: TetR/AcrR family transcriptional regulator [Actinomycetota bacterium]|nr:TetR/AcrR family transcriptional regulator [Actinomycetota bacterium]
MSQVMDFSADLLSPQARRILDAALTCIGRVGLAKTTLDDVAREAGCARATVYRCFPNKQQLLSALVAREAAALRDAVVSAAASSETLGDAIIVVLTTAVGALRGHAALAFIATHELELLLPFLAFEREDAVLRTAAALAAPAYTRFLNDVDATRLGEWIARIALSYFFSPSESFDIGDVEHVRALVDDFVLPGFVNSQGVSR